MFRFSYKSVKVCTAQHLQKISTLDCTFLDLSLPMLKQAEKRIKELTSGQIKTIQVACVKAYAQISCHNRLFTHKCLIHTFFLRNESKF